MACFIAPATEALVTTFISSRIKKKELTSPEKVHCGASLSEKMSWLNRMLWGGSGLLAFEHLWHGEITPWFPFLTKAADATEAMEMLYEMATSGVAMAVIVTAVWGVMVAVSNKVSSSSSVPAKENL